MANVVAQSVDTSIEGKSLPARAAFEAIRVSSSDPEAKSAVRITAAAGASAEEVSILIADAVKSRYWHEQDHYKKLGQPKEHIRIKLSNGSQVEIYNWVRHLSESEIKSVESTLQRFASVAGGEALKSTDSILIDPSITENPNLSRLQRGHSGPTRSVTLLAPALEEHEYEISGVTRFEAVLIHELTHKIAERIEVEWQKRFAWSWDDNARRGWVCGEPDRCVTEYAKMLPSDDICESMVALLKNPNALDPEKRKFLQEALAGPDARQDSLPKIEETLVLHEGIKLPETPHRIYYIQDEPTIRLRRRHTSGAAQP